VNIAAVSNVAWRAADREFHITALETVNLLKTVYFPYLHFARGIAEAKCILVTAICVSVCVCLSVSHRISTLLHGRGCNLGEWWGCPVVVHYWTDFQSVHGFRCYDSSAECQMSASACTRSMPGLLPAVLRAAQIAGIQVTQTPILRFFASQGRHVAPMGVKFSTEEWTYAYGLEFL